MIMIIVERDRGIRLMILFLNLNNIISQVYIDKKAILYHDI